MAPEPMIGIDTGLHPIEKAILGGSTAMSAVAGGLFIEQVIGGFQWPAFVGGAAWGALIGIVDWSLLAAPKDKNMGLRIVRFMPRAVLAFASGVLVAGAFVTSLYHSEIDARLAADHAAVIALVHGQAVTQEQPAVNQANAKADVAQQILDKARADVAAAADRFGSETNGVRTAGTTGKVGYGPVAKGAEQLVGDARQRLADAETAYKQAVTDRDKVVQDAGKKVDDTTQERRGAIEADSGPLSREKALREVITEHPEIGRQVKYLSASLILLDLAPALMALMSRRSYRDRAIIAADDARAEIAEKMARESVESPAMKQAVTRHGERMAEVIRANSDAEVERGLAKAAGARSRGRRLLGARENAGSRRRLGVLGGAAVVAILALLTALLTPSGHDVQHLPQASTALAAATMTTPAGASEGCKRLAASPAIARLTAAAETALDNPEAAGPVYVHAATDLKVAAVHLGTAKDEALTASDILTRLGAAPTDPATETAAANALAALNTAMEQPCLA